ncbi:ATP-binding cassette domain-containing protein [Ferrimonas pelagia]|uniref:ABC transporter domain-containing protein n=1 Tax=Ferrimonas pelagia TaxID=1177826 RepID=A0ABP9F0T6_9GAMM
MGLLVVAMRLELALAGKLGEFEFDLQLDQVMDGALGVFGPSGVGKTSLIRAIAGLERGLPGRIVLDGEVLQDTAAGIFVPIDKRRIGLVFQDSRLFPHLTVRQNLALALRQTRQPIFSIQELAHECCFSELLDQPAPSLSAGQRQRVAIARALIAAPRLLLLDEPLAALDMASRQHLLDFLQRVSARIPLLFISHSVAETLQLCDPIAVMTSGRIAQIGPGEAMAPSLPKRRGLGTVVAVDPASGQVTIQLDEFAPDLALAQVVGVVSEPSWLKGRE